MDNAVKKKSGRTLILLVITAIVALAAVGIVFQNVLQKQKKPQIDVTIALEKIVKTSDLSTAVFQYDGIVEVLNPKKPKDVDYYIYYSASVYAGIDFSEVQFTEDEENKKILATIPKVQINDTVVDPNSLDFMFMNKKADNVSVTATALTACETDIQQECTSDSALLEIAQMNAENAVRALAEPIIEQVCEGYTLEINEVGEHENQD